MHQPNSQMKLKQLHTTIDTEQRMKLQHTLPVSKKQPVKIKSGVLWLTGLSGAGKSTIANKLSHKLSSEGCSPIVLDGDIMRTILKEQGFDEQSRKEYNRTIARLACYLQLSGHLVIVALISPYQKIRDEAREICRNFFEVHVAADLKTCIERDTKGLYAKALRGEIKDFTGISAPYEAPVNPELVLDTAACSVDVCVDEIIQLLKCNNHE